MGAIASQITSLTIVYSIGYSDTDHRKHQSSASLAFVRGIHRGPVNSPHKWPVTRKIFPFDDVIMVDVITYPCSCHFWFISLQWRHSGRDSVSNHQPHWFHKYSSLRNWWLRYLLWNCHQININGSHWWQVNIGSGNGLVPPCNEPLPEPML